MSHCVKLPATVSAAGSGRIVSLNTRDVFSRNKSEVTFDKQEIGLRMFSKSNQLQEVINYSEYFPFI